MLRVFDVETGEELWQDGSLDLLGQGPWAVGFLPDNETLVVSDSMDNRITFRERATGQKRRFFRDGAWSESSTVAVGRPTAKPCFSHRNPYGLGISRAAKKCQP